MNTDWGSAPSTPIADYVSRNAMWLRPAAATVIAIGAPAVASVGAPQIVANFPSWLAPTAAVLGSASVGIGAAMTDTTSAAIIRFVGLAGVLGGLAYYIFG